MENQKPSQPLQDVDFRCCGLVFSPYAIVGTAAMDATFTSTNFFASASFRRFRHAKKCGAHSPRSRQNAATLSPLLPCWEISFRHFFHACFLRWVMAPACYHRWLQR